MTSRPTNGYDAIVVGAGHNGLTAAAYLARGGRKVLVLEAADNVGGAARNSEFADGFTVSAAAHLLYHLHPKVMADLDLQRHGLALANADVPAVALAADGRHMVLSDGASVATHSAADAGALPAFRQRMLRLARIGCGRLMRAQRAALRRRKAS